MPSSAPGTNGRALLAVMLAAGSRLRAPGTRTLVVTLALAMLFMAFEIGVHSTHHLRDPQGARTCAIAAASAHQAAVTVDGVPVGPIGPPAREPALEVPSTCVSSSHRAAYDGRAPPLSSA